MRSKSSRIKEKNREKGLIYRLKDKIKDHYEEFKLNRQGKTKRKRADVKSRHRKIAKTLTALIIIIGLLLAISWIVVLYY